jgi:ubiquitin-protein ligase
MSLALKRIAKEIEKMNKGKLPFGIKVTPREDILIWDAEITGGKDTPHENLTYKLLVRIDKDDYPRKPPSIKFISNIFHPNVYRDGQICIDILQGQWAPTLRIISVLVSIQSMLDDPNPNSPANREAAKLYMSNQDEYKNQIIKSYKQNI